LVQVKYGVPVPAYGMPFDLSNFVALYGPPSTPSLFTILVSVILNPFVIIISFIIGSVLYFFTHKKVFIIIPLILGTLSLVWNLVKTLFGIY